MNCFLNFLFRISILHCTFIFYNLHSYALFLYFSIWDNYIALHASHLIFFIAYIHMHYFKTFSCRILKPQTYFFYGLTRDLTIWSG